MYVYMHFVWCHRPCIFPPFNNILWLSFHISSHLFISILLSVTQYFIIWICHNLYSQPHLEGHFLLGLLFLLLQSWSEHHYVSCVTFPKIPIQYIHVPVAGYLNHRIHISWFSRYFLYTSHKSWPFTLIMTTLYFPTPPLAMGMILSRFNIFANLCGKPGLDCII